MRKFKALLAAFLLAALPRFAMASGYQMYTMLSGATGITNSANFTFASWDYINIRVVCTANCPATATVLLCKLQTTTDTPLCTVSIPSTGTTISAAGEYWGFSITPFTQVQVSAYTSGTIAVTVDAFKR